MVVGLARSNSKQEKEQVRTKIIRAIEDIYHENDGGIDRLTIAKE